MTNTKDQSPEQAASSETQTKAENRSAPEPTPTSRKAKTTGQHLKNHRHKH